MEVNSHELETTIKDHRPSPSRTCQRAKACAKVTVTTAQASPDADKQSPAGRESLADANGKVVFDVPVGCYQVAATSEGLKGQGEEICVSTSGGVASLAIEMKLD